MNSLHKVGAKKADVKMQEVEPNLIGCLDSSRTFSNSGFYIRWIAIQVDALLSQQQSLISLMCQKALISLRGIAKKNEI